MPSVNAAFRLLARGKRTLGFFIINKSICFGEQLAQKGDKK